MLSLKSLSARVLLHKPTDEVIELVDNNCVVLNTLLRNEINIMRNENENEINFIHGPLLQEMLYDYIENNKDILWFEYYTVFYKDGSFNNYCYNCYCNIFKPKNPFAKNEWHRFNIKKIKFISYDMRADCQIIKQMYFLQQCYTCHYPLFNVTYHEVPEVDNVDIPIIETIKVNGINDFMYAALCL